MLRRWLLLGVLVLRYASRIGLLVAALGSSRRVIPVRGRLTIPSLRWVLLLITLIAMTLHASISSICLLLMTTLTLTPSTRMLGLLSVELLATSTATITLMASRR